MCMLSREKKVVFNSYFIFICFVCDKVVNFYVKQLISHDDQKIFCSEFRVFVLYYKLKSFYLNNEKIYKTMREKHIELHSQQKMFSLNKI